MSVVRHRRRNNRLWLGGKTLQFLNLFPKQRGRNSLANSDFVNVIVSFLFIVRLSSRQKNANVTRLLKYSPFACTIHRRRCWSLLAFARIQRRNMLTRHGTRVQPIMSNHVATTMAGGNTAWRRRDWCRCRLASSHITRSRPHAGSALMFTQFM